MKGATKIYVLRNELNKDSGEKHGMFCNRRYPQTFSSALVCAFLFSFFAFLLPCADAQEASLEEEITNQAGARAKKTQGNVGEALTDQWYKEGGWEKIQGEVGNTGIDGVYVKRDAQGNIRDVLMTESKTGSSQLGTTQAGNKQLSKDWNVGNLQKREEHLIRQLTEAENAGNQQEVRRIKNQLDNLRQIKKHVENEAGNVRYRLHRVYVADGHLIMEISDVDSYQKSVEKRAPRTEKVDLRKKPSEPHKRKMYDAYFKSLEDELRKYMPEKEAKTVVQDIQKGFANGTLNTDKDVYELIIKKFKERIKHEKNVYKKALLRTQLAKKQLAKRLSAKARVSTNAAGVVGGLSALGHGWAVYKGEEEISEASLAVAKDASVAASSIYVTEGIVQKCGEKYAITALQPGTVSGAAGGLLNYGVATFLFDGINHVYHLSRDDITTEQFVERTSESLVKSFASGGAASCGILLGATPEGLVVMGVTVGAYIAVDTSFQYYEKWQDRHHLYFKDILWELPLEVQNRITVLNPEDSDRKTILEPEQSEKNTILAPEEGGRKSILHSEESTRETILDQ